MRKRVMAGVIAASLVAGVAGGQVADVLLGMRDARADQVPALAAQAVGEYSSARDLARSAPQVSQIADETMVPLTYALVKQNQEIIRLLKKLANEP
jgi:hypothetical protein